MSKKRKIIYITIAAAIVIIAALAIIFMPKTAPQTVTEMLSTAQKYLVEMEYERAIAEFNKVIELDPMNADAYLGLAEAYEKNGQHDKAVETLEKGFEVTSDERLKTLLWSSFEVNDIVTGMCSAIDNYECRIWFNLNSERAVNSVWCNNSFEYYINASTASGSSSERNTETVCYYSEDNTYCGKEEIITDSTNRLIGVNFYDENNNLMHQYTFKSEISDDNVVHTFQYENDELLVSESIFYSENHYELLMYNSNKQVVEKKEFIKD